jgi:Family of unknown function (DUF6152)
MGLTLSLTLAALAIAGAPSLALAHHSTAYFSHDFVELEGVITSVEWRNPHVAFMLRTTDPDGSPVTWRLVSNSLYDLKRAGITREYLEVGSKVKIAGHPSELEEHVALATNMMLPDGTEVVMRRDAEPYWSSEHVGGRDHWLVDQNAAADATGHGIFRVWSASEIRAEQVHYPYTQKARDAQATWDPLHNFIVRCEAPGMPYIMTSPHPHEFVDHGGEITLRIAWFDQARTIHMNHAPGEEPAASPLGYSVGHFEGNTLLVETSRVNWPYADRSGTPQSEAVRITERFTLSQDEKRLDYRMTIVDPLAFTEPATYETAWLALGEAIEPYNCEVF